jgi:hypothetical protein
VRLELNVKDYIVPLACGGPDAVSDMQWQTIRAAKANDKWETKGCARRRELPSDGPGHDYIDRGSGLHPLLPFSTQSRIDRPRHPLRSLASPGDLNR